MVRAHRPAPDGSVLAHGCGCVRHRERGFGLIEIIIVVVIIAILLAVAILPSLASTQQKVGGPKVNLAAGAIWRGVLQYRNENGGVLPPVALLTGQHTQTPAGGTFVNPGNGRYIERWPDDTRGRPMEVVAGAGVPPNGPVAPGSPMAGRVVYATAPGPSPITGWVAGFADNGQLVFRRSIEPVAAARPPLG